MTVEVLLAHRSPLNRMQWHCDLSCGHEAWITSSKKPKAYDCKEKHMTEEEYKSRFEKRLIERGLPAELAEAQANAADFDPRDPEPEDHADDCYYYLMEDGR